MATTFNPTDGYYHDNANYEEIGELHNDKSYPVVGKIENRYTSNKKKSIVSPDSDRLIYNYFSSPDVKDFTVVKETSIRAEKQVYVGQYFLAIYDANVGSFVCENVKAFLKDLVKPVSEGGLGEDGPLSEVDFDSICKNMKYVSAMGDEVFIVSEKSNGENVLFKLNPYTYEIGNYHYDNFKITVGNKMVYCKPMVISDSNMYFVCRNSSNGVNCYYLDTYHDRISEDTAWNTAVGNLLGSNVTVENSIVMVQDEDNRMVYIIANNSNGDKAIAIYITVDEGTLHKGFIGGTSISGLPGTISSNAKFLQYSLAYDGDDESNSLANGYILIATSNNTIIALKKNSPVVGCNYRTISGGTLNGFFRTINKCPASINAAGFEHCVSVVCTKTDGKRVIKTVPLSTFEANGVIDISNCGTSAITDTYSDGFDIKNNFFSNNGSNIIIGKYNEDGRTRPLIKDIGTEFNLSDLYSNGNYENVSKARTFRNGLESDSGVSLVKGIDLGTTQVARLRITPEALSRKEVGAIQDTSSEIFMRESYTTDDSDGKFTKGSFLWKMLANLGIPYNTHVTAIGRIILDGKDIPIEKVMITAEDPELRYGNTLLTIDKSYDLSSASETFTKNGRSLYPGILFKANEGFLEDAIISNVYNVDGAFAYNDSDRGALLDSGYFDIKASCVVNNGDEQYLIIATNFGKLASLNIKTGGYTKYTGAVIGEGAPGFSINASIADWDDRGDIFRIEQFGKYIYVFYTFGSIYRASLENRSFVEYGRFSENIPQDYNGYQNIKVVSAKYNNIVYFASNVAKDNIHITTFDLETGLGSMSSGLTSTWNINGNADTIEVKGDIYCFDNGGTMHIFSIGANVISSYTSAAFAGLGGNIVYDGNDRIYIVGKTKAFFGYFTISSKTFASLTAPTSTCGGNLTHDFVNGTDVISFVKGTTKYKYTVQLSSWETSSTSETVVDRNTSSIYIDGCLEYYVNGSSLMCKNIRDNNKTIQCGTPINFDSTTLGSKFISSIGFANKGKNLVISHYDGGIASIYLPMKEYYGPDYEETYVKITSTETNVTVASGKTLKDQLTSTPTLSGYQFNHWSFTENGPQLSAADLASGAGTYKVYAVFSDNIETYIGRSISRIFAKPGEFMDEGATSITNIEDDVIFNGAKCSVRWAERVGCFFKGRDDKYTDQYVEGDNDHIKSNEPIIPIPMCDAGICHIGKYIIYVNGYNKYSDLPPATCHNGIICYDTEEDEYAVMYSGEDNLHGTKRAKIRPFCYAFDNYIYSFGGLERVDEHIGADNFSRFIRTAKIEQIDLITGKINELSATFGPDQPIVKYVDNGIGDMSPVYSDIGLNEIRHLTRIGNTLTGYISMNAGNDQVTDSNGNKVMMSEKFTFDLATKSVTRTTQTSTTYAHKFIEENGTEVIVNRETGASHVDLIPLFEEDVFEGCEKDSVIEVNDEGIFGVNNTTKKSLKNDLPLNFTDKFKSITSLSQYTIRVPQKLEDGRIFIEGETSNSLHATNEVNALSYSHIYLEGHTFETELTGYKTTSSGTKIVLEKEENMYVIGHTTKNLTVEVVDKVSKVGTVSKTAKLAGDFGTVHAILCDDMIIIFNTIDGNTSVLTYSIDRDTLKLRTLSGEYSTIDIEEENYIYSSKYKTIFFVDGNAKLTSIRFVSEESHNKEDAIYTNYISDVTVSSNGYGLRTKDDELVVYSVVDGKLVSETIILTDSGDVESKYILKMENSIENKDILLGKTEEIKFDIVSSIITKKVRKIPAAKECEDFNSYTLGPGNHNSFVCNDGKDVYTSTESFDRLYKTSIETGITHVYKFDKTAINEEIEDIAALKGIVYIFCKSGDLLIFDTEVMSMKIVKICESINNATDSVKLCQDNSDYIYILKNDTIIRFGIHDYSVKEYLDTQFNGSVINVRYIDALSELRFATADFERNVIGVYSFDYEENEIEKIKDITGFDLSSVSGSSNILDNKYIIPIHFDDNGNIYIFGNPETGSSSKIIFIDGNTFDTYQLVHDNNLNDIMVDVSISKDDVYVLSKNSATDDQIHLIKSKKPFDYVKPTKMGLIAGNAMSNKRVFCYNGEYYMYGSDNFEHTILKFNETTKTLTQYSSGSILDQSHEFNDDTVIGIKVFGDGTVIIIGMRETSTAGYINLVGVSYNLKSMSVDNSFVTKLAVPNASADNLSVYASVQGDWNSHYFTTVIAAEDSNEATAITIDGLTGTVKDQSNVNISENGVAIIGAVAVFDGKVYHVGGYKEAYNPTSTVNENDGIAAEYSAIKNVNPSHFANYKAGNFNKNCTLIKSGSRLIVVDNSGYSNILRRDVNPFDIEREISNGIERFTDEQYKLNPNSIAGSNYVIPVADNCVIIGNNNFYGAEKNDELDHSKNSRIYKVPCSPIITFDKNGYGVKVYSGCTKDIFVTTDEDGNIIDKLEVEREYGLSVCDVKEIDTTRSVIIYSNTPNIGTLFIHDNGNITVKRYDGAIYGKPINNGTNVHTIQEVDLTLLFDSEASEKDFREVTIDAN